MSSRDHGGIATPIGFVSMTAIDGRLCALWIGGEATLNSNSALLNDACTQIEAWFAGERQHFDLPLTPAATPRGAALRAGMIDISYGRTMTYGGLATILQSSPRAIGQACARNPLPIIVPCHRILPAGGQTGAYSAGDGPATKAWLLKHEQHFSGEAQ